MAEKKNCHTCAHLEYETGDEYGCGSGWYCEKREPRSIKEERAMLEKFSSEDYRNRYKRCFEPKASAAQVGDGCIGDNDVDGDAAVPAYHGL
jgi:hypothetical protein